MVGCFVLWLVFSVSLFPIFPCVDLGSVSMHFGLAHDERYENTANQSLISRTYAPITKDSIFVGLLVVLHRST
jgi:hypothetical protein